MFVGTTSLVSVSSGKSVKNSILMNYLVTLLVILQIATKDTQKNASTAKIIKDASLIYVSFYIR